MSNKIQAYSQAIGCTVLELSYEIRIVAESVSRDVTILARVKDPDILDMKMEIKEVDKLFDIHDIYGIRILVNSVGEAYDVLSVISTTYKGFIDHDYISNPKTRPDDPSLNGKMLRLLQYVAYKNHVPFEIQITTHEFHTMNESLHQGYHRRKYL